MNRDRGERGTERLTPRASGTTQETRGGGVQVHDSRRATHAADDSYFRDIRDDEVVAYEMPGRAIETAALVSQPPGRRSALISGLTAARPPAAGGPLGPSCFADDPRVAVPAAPHGMYAWIYNRNALEQLRPVIGTDPTLCGGSIVVYWSDVEPQEGRFDFSAVEREAEAFTSKGLRVNFPLLRGGGRGNQYRDAGVGLTAGAARQMRRP